MGEGGEVEEEPSLVFHQVFWTNFLWKKGNSQVDNRSERRGGGGGEESVTDNVRYE